jgi:hypothetical protein
LAVKVLPFRLLKALLKHSLAADCEADWVALEQLASLEAHEVVMAAAPEAVQEPWETSCQ